MEKKNEICPSMASSACSFSGTPRHVLADCNALGYLHFERHYVSRLETPKYWIFGGCTGYQLFRFWSLPLPPQENADHGPEAMLVRAIHLKCQCWYAPPIFVAVEIINFQQVQLQG
jgi:hypothetical protein